MRTNWIMLACLLLVVLLIGCTKEGTPRSPVEDAGEEVIRLLQGREYDNLYETWFTAELQESLSMAELARDWEEKTEGDFVELNSLQAESQAKGIDVVEASLKYTTGLLEIRMVFNEEMHLVGFRLSDGFAESELPDSILEEEVIIGKGTEYELEGLLTLLEKGPENFRQWYSFTAPDR